MLLMQKSSMKSFEDIPDNDVTITTDSNFVATITCEKAKFTIPGKAGEDFAYLPVIEKDESLNSFSVYFERNDSSDNLFHCS